MSNVARSICLNHPLREAAAKCMGCGKSFCRECVTALDRRMFCSGCLSAKTEVKAKAKRDWFLVGAAVQLALGLVLLWLGCYGLGKFLLSVPSEYHEGSVWESVMDPL
jgi:hypothetical protein